MTSYGEDSAHSDSALQPISSIGYCIKYYEKGNATVYAVKTCYFYFMSVDRTAFTSATLAYPD